MRIKIHKQRVAKRDPVKEFDIVRKEYLKELQELRNKYTKKFESIIKEANN